jgi:hypothetical protein
LDEVLVLAINPSTVREIKSLIPSMIGAGLAPLQSINRSIIFGPPVPKIPQQLVLPVDAGNTRAVTLRLTLLLNE